MSTKIYREVTSKFNDETQKWETISEDSYDYDGPMDLVQGGDMDEDWRNLEEVFKDLGKTFEKAMKKAVNSGASSYKKSFISAGAAVNKALKDNTGHRRAITRAGLEDSSKQYLLALEQFQQGLISAADFSSAAQEFENAMHNSKLGKNTRDELLRGIHGATTAAELQEAHDNIQEAFSEGIQDGLGILPSNTFTKVLGIDAASEQASKALSDKLAPMLTGLGKFMGRHWGAALAVGVAFAIISAISSLTDEIGEEFGAIGAQTFGTDLIAAKATATELGYEFSDVADSVKAMSNEFGISFGDAIEISKASMDTARALGISTDQAGELTGLLMQMGGHSAESAQNFLKQGAALAKSAGISPAAVMSDISGSAEELAGFMKDGGENIMQAAVGARKMGMNLGEVVSMADSLLDFQSSIEKEMTASVMVGKNLNLQRARELALAGDLAGMTEEVLDNVVSEAEWNELNVLQRKSIADALGVSVQSMSKMVEESGKTFQQLKAMRELDISEIVSDDALSNITVFMNNLKAIGLWFLTGISWMTNFFGEQGEGWDMVGTAITLVLVGLVLLSVWLGFVAVQGYVAGLGAGAAAGGVGALDAAMVGLAATAPVAGPALASLAATGWSLAATAAALAVSIGMVVAGIVGIVYLLPPVIDAFGRLGTVITDNIIKLVDNDTILGIIGLAGAFYILTSALIAMSTAGMFAMPVIQGVAAIAGIGLGAMAIGGWLFGGKDEIKWIELQTEIQAVATAVNDLKSSTLKVKIAEGQI